MVEVIHVKDWRNLTAMRYGFMPKAFWIRMSSEEDLFLVAKTLELPFVFKKGKELLCTDGHVAYWYK